MAEELDDSEFWLPTDFLMDKGGVAQGCGVWFPNEFPYGFDSSFGSDLSSPVESLVGSTETESDEEEYVAGLANQMARSMLIDDHLHHDAEKPKKSVMSSSPQSTLCAVGSWCQYGQRGGGGSSRGSPNGPSQRSSPPSTPFSNTDDAWDLLSAATDQVVRLKLMNEETQRVSGRGLLGGPPHQPATTGYFSNLPLAQQHFQNAKFQQLQKQQGSGAWVSRQDFVSSPCSQPQQMQLGGGSQVGVSSFKNGSKGGRSVCLSASAWPPLPSQPQQPSTGMRAVFLGAAAARRESSGTGVFLPRRPGTPTEPRKKPACSTVLVPARVIQALNLNLDEVGSAQRRVPPSYVHHSTQVPGPWAAARSNTHVALPRKPSQTARPAPTINPEIHLPPEWTY